jgi:hypothetical protein
MPYPSTCAALLPRWSCINDLRATRRAERAHKHQERMARFLYLRSAKA